MAKRQFHSSHADLTTELRGRPQSRHQSKLSLNAIEWYDYSSSIYNRVNIDRDYKLVIF